MTDLLVDQLADSCRTQVMKTHPAQQRRAAILRQVLSGIFDRTDEKCGFTAEQRRLIWNNDSLTRCRSCDSSKGSRRRRAA